MLGKDPYTDEEITLRNGRFGPYVQRGDGKEAKRSSLPKGWTVEAMDHEKALALLSLPRDVGKHPESGKMISAGLGRYGPFVLHDGTYANLDSIEDVFSIGLNRAVTVIAEKQSKGKAGRGGTPAALKNAWRASGWRRPSPFATEIRSLCESWQGQCDAAEGQGPDDRDASTEALALIAERDAKGGGGQKSSGARKPAAKGEEIDREEKEGIRPIGQETVSTKT